MSLPWIQLETDFVLIRSRMVAAELAVSQHEAIGMATALIHFAVEATWSKRCPPHGKFPTSNAASLLEAVMDWRGQPGLAIAAFMRVGVLEPFGDGGLRVRGTRRYKRTWEKNFKKKAPPEAEWGPSPNLDCSQSVNMPAPEAAPLPAPEMEIETKAQIPPVVPLLLAEAELPHPPTPSPSARGGLEEMVKDGTITPKEKEERLFLEQSLESLRRGEMPPPPLPPLPDQVEAAAEAQRQLRLGFQGRSGAVPEPIQTGRLRAPAEACAHAARLETAPSLAEPKENVAEQLLAYSRARVPGEDRSPTPQLRADVESILKHFSLSDVLEAIDHDTAAGACDEKGRVLCARQKRLKRILGRMLGSRGDKKSSSRAANMSSSLRENMQCSPTVDRAGIAVQRVPALLPDKAATPAEAVWYAVLLKLYEEGKRYALGTLSQIDPAGIEGGVLLLRGPDRYFWRSVEDLYEAHVLEALRRTPGFPGAVRFVSADGYQHELGSREVTHATAEVS